MLSNHRVSSGRFDHTEPPRTTVMNGEAGLQGMFRVSLEQFDYTEPLQTTVMNGEAGLQGMFRVSSEQFDHTEPPQTTNVFTLLLLLWQHKAVYNFVILCVWEAVAGLKDFGAI